MSGLDILFCVLGYFAIGIIGARGVFEYDCRFARPAYHDRPPFNTWRPGADEPIPGKSETHNSMFFTFVGWPLLLLAAIVYGVCVGSCKAITAKPPSKHPTKGERLAELKKRNTELEKQLRLGDYAVMDIPTSWTNRNDGLKNICRDRWEEDVTKYHPYNQGGIV